MEVVVDERGRGDGLVHEEVRARQSVLLYHATLLT